MEHRQKNPICPVCGGSEYYVDVGFYFCAECQTQSQELREEVCEIRKGRTLHTRATSGKDIALQEGKEWTSWEAYNFILKGQVEELIELGVSPSLKIIVLQLWACYLKHLQVAFTSWGLECLPRLGPQYNRKDLCMLYGAQVPVKRRPKKKKQKNVNDFPAEELKEEREKFFRKTRAKFMAEKCEAHLQSTDPACTQSQLSNVSKNASCMASNRTRILYSKEAKRVMKKPQKRRYTQVYQELHNFGYMTPTYITRYKLLVLIYIGLLFLGESVQLSDMLRWVQEGHLSYYDITRLLPNNFLIMGRDCIVFSTDVSLPSYSIIHKTTQRMLKFLKISHWPKPDILLLATRFIKELQLPRMLSTFVERFIVLTPMSVTWDSGKLPNYEGRAVALIIVVLKLLLGLDGLTEDKISATATKINMLLSKESSTSTRLFVWTDWVQYVVCRKAVLIRHHFPTKNKVAPDVYINSETYIASWEDMWRKYEDAKSKRILSGNVKQLVVDAMKRPFQKLKDLEHSNSPKIEFPPSLTPLTTYIKCVLESYKNDEIPTEILSQNFRVTDMEYLVNPNHLMTLSKSDKWKLNVKRRSAHKTCKIRKKLIKTQFSKVTFNNKLVIVRILKPNEYKKYKRNRVATASEFHRHQSTRLEGFRGSGGSRTSERSGTRNSAFKDKNLKNPGVALSSVNHEVTKLVDISDKSTDRMEPSVCKLRRRMSIPSVMPDEAVEMLNKYMLEANKHSPIQPNIECSSKKETYKFYLPYTQYWIFEGTIENLTDESFEEEIFRKLPHSFCWLLTECAQMVEMSNRELFIEVLAIERICSDVLK